MITKIVLDNIYVRGEKIEVELPKSILQNTEATYEEWEKFYIKVDAIKAIRTYFDNTVNPDVEPFSNSDPSKESVIEIQMEWEGKIYKYSTTYYNSELVMESLLGDGNWIFSRIKDTPDFALDPNYLEEGRAKDYEKYKGLFRLYNILYFTPGIELMKEIKNMIIVDDWKSLTRTSYLEKFKREFPGLNYKEIIDEMISNFGFSEYKGIAENGLYLISDWRSGVLMPVESSGSGFAWLSFIVPLMVAAKKYGILLVSTIPLDNCLHPILGKALMKWYLKDNLNYPVCRLHNVKL